MSVSIKINRLDEEVEIYLDGELTETLSGEEAFRFLLQAEKQAKENSYLFNQQYRKLTIEDIEDAGCPIEELTGLDFQIDIFSRNFPSYYIGVDFIRNGQKMHNLISLKSNFTAEQVHFGPITNHQLRACLNDELIQYLWDVPNFKINLGNANDFFNENMTFYYHADVSSDS